MNKGETNDAAFNNCDRGSCCVVGGNWQVSADDMEGVAYGSKVLLRADGTWAYSEENTKAKTEDGKAVELKSDNTWEYVEVQLKGAITFRITAMKDWQGGGIKRNDEGKSPLGSRHGLAAQSSWR